MKSLRFFVLALLVGCSPHVDAPPALETAAAVASEPAPPTMGDAAQAVAQEMFDALGVESRDGFAVSQSVSVNQMTCLAAPAGCFDCTYRPYARLTLTPLAGGPQKKLNWEEQRTSRFCQEGELWTSAPPPSQSSGG